MWCLEGMVARSLLALTAVVLGYSAGRVWPDTLFLIVLALSMILVWAVAVD